MSTATEPVLGSDAGTEKRQIAALVLVEDPEDLKRLASHLAELPSWSASVIPQSEPAAAIAYLQHHAVDIVFLDDNLRGLTGLEVLYKFQALGFRVPVVLITERGTERHTVEVLHAGASDYLTKSGITTQHLNRVITSALERNSRTVALHEHRQELESANAALSAKNDAIRELYHRLSHELKTPLTSTQAFLSILHDGIAGPLTASQQECAHMALEGCEQMLMCIDDLLESSRIDAGKLVLREQACDIAVLLTEVTQFLAARAKEKSIRLHQRVAPGLPPVRIDPRRVKQILLNLVDNALKFTPGGGEIEVGAERPTREAGVLQVHVHDSGKGISPESIKQVFDPLFQDTSGVDLPEARAGLGLGLSICSELVALHRGRIWVDSQLGVGSTFYFTLPICDNLVVNA